MKTDLLFLCHDRLEFTRAALKNLLANTTWDLINEFVIYNDFPSDDKLRNLLQESVDIVGGTIRETEIGSPVGVMNHFLQRCRADLFAKIDNDIIVPPGWLTTLQGVMERHPELELLGMEPGMSGMHPVRGKDGTVLHSYLNTTHIGGVGLMRRSAFQRLPPLVPNGRFGFTEWQHTYRPNRAWVQPDLFVFCLDFLPIEPWRSLTAKYMKTPGLQRDWPKYDPKMSWAWEWWTG